MQELRPGIYRWTASHPDWEPDEGWDQQVASYAIDDGQRVVIVDPLAPPPQLDDLIAEREAIIVLTCPWHRRDALDLAERLGATIHVPPPDEGHTYRIPGEVYGAGDSLPGGIRVFPGMEPSDLVLWISAVGAVVCGDTLIERNDTLVIPVEWVSEKNVEKETVIRGLRPLLDLPVEIVLTTHGKPCSPLDLKTLLS